MVSRAEDPRQQITKTNATRPRYNEGQTPSGKMNENDGMPRVMAKHTTVKQDISNIKFKHKNYS